MKYFKHLEIFLLSVLRLFITSRLELTQHFSGWGYQISIFPLDFMGPHAHYVNEIRDMPMEIRRVYEAS